MRVILDTNILVSMLLTKGTPPDRLYGHWKAGRFDLVTCERQVEEIRKVTRRLRKYIKPSEAGRLVNDIKSLAILVDPLPKIERSPDPDDNWLLAVAEKSRANFLVTGDKSDLLSLEKHGVTKIVTARFLVDQLEN